MLILMSILIAWTAWYAYRLKRGDRTVTLDAMMSLVCETLYAVDEWKREKSVGNDGSAAVTLAVVIGHAVALGLLNCFVQSPALPLNVEQRQESTEKEQQPAPSSTDPPPSPTTAADESDVRTAAPMHHLIIPSRTTHARYSPRPHSFSYAYLLVGVPVPSSAAPDAHEPPLLSSEANSCVGRRRTFHVSAADHLARDSPGSPRLSLRAKLDAYLRGQGADPAFFPSAWLVTAPRVAGYAFNPASFWYLYSRARRLEAVLVEVNNTFDERRVYFLARGGDGGAEMRARWAKDFHVSPFNDREGTYGITAVDPRPFSDEERAGQLTVANRILLRKEDGSAKIMARIYSTGEPLHPERLGWAARCRVVCRHGLLGFLTFPRILREAWTLFFKTKLQVWFRPEVLQGSIPRQPSENERILEKFFARFLAHRVASADFGLCVHYKPYTDSGLGTDMTFYSKINGDVKDVQEMEIRPLSPVFFTRFIHYAHTLESFDGEFLCTDVKNKTVSVSRPELLPRVVGDHSLNGRRGDAGSPASAWQERSSSIERLRWRVLKWLRCPPAQQSYPPPEETATTGLNVEQKIDIRSMPFSELDLFAWRHCPEDSWLYRRSALKQFIAQRITAGILGAVAALDVLVRFSATFLGWRWVSTIAASPNEVLGGATRSSVVPLCSSFGVIWGALTIYGSHFWNLIKGF